MKNELISMVSFVLAQHHRGNGNHTVGDEVISFHSVLKYANFINTPLNISMFVPAIKVVDKWEVLEMPESLKGFYETDKEGMIQERKDVKQYQTAKDNVLFEGFELIFNTHLSNGNSEINIKNLKDNAIEYLIEFDVCLTKKGLEVSGLNR